MEINKSIKPKFYFEVSWEVCNKVGGIHTVVATKALNLSEEFGDSHILIGPDVWRSVEPNPEFIEDLHLFKSWRMKALQEGIRVKIGRWNIAGKPIVFLVDFTTFIPDKDTILADYWQKNRLDSLSGEWDYVESALFGHAAGKAIESFIIHSNSSADYSIGHFHEWMTGSGLLYLSNVMPQVATMFITHATVLGRCAAGNHLPLYSEMSNFNPDELAHRYNVVAKHSLERCAAHHADCFTTVSEITAKECEKFLEKPVDIVTPNGFEPNFTPSDDEYDSKRAAGRKRITQVTEALLGQRVSDDALYIGIGGRYEYKNKGIDIFLLALERLKNKDYNDREIIAYILIPGGYNGVNQDLVHNLENPSEMVRCNNVMTTHNLSTPQYDPILNSSNYLNLNNSVDSKIKVIFAPCYLNGNDGVFNMPYYDVLIGLDLTVFPSYYEPWGYTPLESLAFRIPTITTTLAGFGLWVNDYYTDAHPGIKVIERDDYNTQDVVKAISSTVRDFSEMKESEIKQCMTNAHEVSNIALWKNLLINYKRAFEIALSKAIEKPITDFIKPSMEKVNFIDYKNMANTPKWTNIIVQKHIPEKLVSLEIISKNLWWCWNEDARELFRMVDAAKWKETGHNPVAMLNQISLVRYKELENDPAFLAKLDSVYAHFTAYMNEKPNSTGPGVAYFCMEYALHTALKIYSGGLGVLAGDYLKEASDKGVKMTAIGLYYRYGYFTQQLSSHGEQEAKYDAQDFMQSCANPVLDENGNWQLVKLSFPGRAVEARIWRVDVGRVELYLLDTDFEANIPDDRSITHHLYGGSWENRLKQELLLGCGGALALRQLGIEPNVFHYNEGHAAFAGLKRLEFYVKDQNLTFSEAIELVRSSSLFTTHTPVPAGHDFFDEDLLRAYLWHYTDRLQISWEQLMGLGKINAYDKGERFSMSFLAARLSQEVNGVSWLHGEVSKDIFKGLWPGYFPEELHVSYVTNGVHYPTWTAPEWKAIHARLFGADFQTHHYDKSCFDGIYKLEDAEVAKLRQKLRSRLIEQIKKRIDVSQTHSYFTPSQVIKIRETLRDDVLTIGFARRFATYKRAHLLFSNLERLDEIVNNPTQPVQFVFAGKAHPADKAGQDLIKMIVEISKMPQFIGKIIFLPNYDMDLAKYLVSGVDIWMNTPTRPLEASGTSGEKAAMNGVMHFSVLDGWWVEGYTKNAGWKLPMERVYENQAFQDELDAESIYHIIENEIINVFYDKNSDGISTEWVSYIKNTIAKVASNFTTNRMLDDYENQFYALLGERAAKLHANKNEEAIKLAYWKQHVVAEWDNIELVSNTAKDLSNQVISIGENYTAELVLEIGDLKIEDVGLEVLITDSTKDKVTILKTIEFTPVSQENGLATYSISVVMEEPGILKTALRVFPKNDLLPNRQDFALVKWL